MLQRRFVRTKPSGKVSNGAKLNVGPKVPLIECSVVDYSAGGACLQLDRDAATVPSRFELVYGRTRKRCRIVWKTGRRLGVTF